jgi:hypothetical protein
VELERERERGREGGPERGRIVLQSGVGRQRARRCCATVKGGGVGATRLTGGPGCDGGPVVSGRVWREVVL